jgi:TolA-binding protein
MPSDDPGDPPDDAPETKHFGGEIPADVYDLMSKRLDYGEKSEILRRVAEQIAYGGGWDDRTAVDVRIEHLKARLTEKREQRRDIDKQIEELENDLEECQRKREQTQSREERLQAALVGIESDLRAGKRVHTDLAAVHGIAREFNLAPEGVIDKLKLRNPDVPDEAFESPSAGNGPQGRSWDGIDLRKRDLPPAEREEVYRDGL